MTWPEIHGALTHFPHGVGGQGDIGPRLSGNPLEVDEIRKDVAGGLPPVMPAFGQQLSPAQLDAITSYVHWLATQEPPLD